MNTSETLAGTCYQSPTHASGLSIGIRPKLRPPIARIEKAYQPATGIESSPTSNRVILLDDDPQHRHTVREMLETAGFLVRHAAATIGMSSDLTQIPADCLVATFGDSVLNSSAPLQWLTDHGCVVPIIVITSSVTIRSAVRVMRTGVFTLIEQPIRGEEMLSAVHQAVEKNARSHSAKGELLMTRELMKTISQQEQSVLNLIVAGLPNKAIALRLDVSSRTVDRRRRSVLDKLQVESAAALAARIARLELAYQLSIVGR